MTETCKHEGVIITHGYVTDVFTGVTQIMEDSMKCASCGKKLDP